MRLEKRLKARYFGSSLLGATLAVALNFAIIPKSKAGAWLEPRPS